MAAPAFAFLAHASQAQAQGTDRWIADDVQAAATLPLPRNNTAVTGATLSCEAQRWTFRLEIAAGAELEDGTGAMNVDGRSFDLDLATDGNRLSARMPTEALDPLKSGVSMRVDLSGKLEQALGDLAFSLRGSRVAITAAQGRCSLRDMSGYTPVTFTPFSSYMNVVRELRAADIKAFAESTAAQPVLSAAMVEFEEGRRLLFTRLCGSSWYFGISGCNITGFAPGDAQGEWRVVYDSENMHLYTDPRSVAQGWPDVATLPVRSAGTGSLWRWSGGRYEFAGELPEAPERLGLRPGRD